MSRAAHSILKSISYKATYLCTRFHIEAQIVLIWRFTFHAKLEKSLCLLIFFYSVSFISIKFEKILHNHKLGFNRNLVFETDFSTTASPRRLLMRRPLDGIGTTRCFIHVSFRSVSVFSHGGLSSFCILSMPFIGSWNPWMSILLKNNFWYD